MPKIGCLPPRVCLNVTGVEEVLWCIVGSRDGSTVSVSVSAWLSFWRLCSSRWDGEERKIIHDPQPPLPFSPHQPARWLFVICHRVSPFLFSCFYFSQLFHDLHFIKQNRSVVFGLGLMKVIWFFSIEWQLLPEALAIYWLAIISWCFTKVICDMKMDPNRYLVENDIFLAFLKYRRTFRWEAFAALIKTSNQ